MSHSVLRLSFGSGNFKERDYLHTNLMAQLAAIGRQAGIDSAHTSAPERFGELVEALHEHAGQRVVVLVDEYDKPILDTLEVPEVACANRDFLRVPARALRGHQGQRSPHPLQLPFMELPITLCFIDVIFDIKRRGSAQIGRASVPEVPCATARADPLTVGGSPG